MAEYWTCIECEGLFNDTDGDLDERMCNECFDKIHFEELKRGSNDTVKSVMDKVDKIINWVKGERRNPNISRSSTVHYPDWDKKNKEYITRERKWARKKGDTTS